MKIRIITLSAATATLVFSSMAFAGESGGCDSMKGGHKGMQIEALMEMKENHAWLNSPNEHSEKSAASASDQPKAVEVKKSNPDLVEIQAF